MNDILKQIKDAIKAVREKCNAAIKNLPPIEQFEASSEVAYGLRTLNYTASNLEEIWGSLEQKAETLTARFQAEVDAKAKELAETLASGKAATLLNEKLSSGEYVKKTDAEAAAQSAADTREANVRTQLQTLASRRTEIAGLLPAEFASRLSDESILADDYKARAEKVKGRLDKLVAIKANVPSLQMEAAALSLDEKGDAEFESRIKLIEEISKTNPGSRSGGSAPAPLAGASATATDTKLAIV